MKIDFTVEQMTVIDKAVQQLPYYVAAPLIAHINAEIQKNFEAAQDAAETDKQ